MRAVIPLSVVAVLAFFFNGVAAKPIEYVAQERRVRADHQERFGDGDTQETVSASDEIVAYDFGDFDASARAQAVPEFQQAYAEVSQLSRFHDDGITASGMIHGQTGTLWGNYDWESVVGWTFDVEGGPVRYELNYSIDRMEFDEGLRFNDFILNAITPKPLSVFDFDVPHGDDDTTAGTVSGVLSPGRYEFRYRDESSGKDIGETLRYAWTFQLTPVPEPGSTAGTVVLTVAVLLRRHRPAR